MGEYVIQVMWHINDECNYRCRHCYISEQGSRPVDRWKLQRRIVRRIAEFQKHYRILRVGLLGGEPLLDPNFLRIASSLRKSGIERIDVGTNGSLVTDELVSQFRDSGVKMVQVSIEGPGPEINDYVRGSGSFERAIRAIRILKKGMVDTGIMVTLSRFNFPYVEAMYDLALRERVNILSFNRMLPIGRGKRGKLECLKSEEMKQMIGMVHELDRRSRELDVSSDDPLLHIPMGGEIFSREQFGGCGAGVGNLAINQDGSVFPCRRLPIVVGDASVTPLIDIINSSELDCFYRRVEYLKGECRTCQHREICGGCRAAAYAFTGDHLAPDPQCWKIGKRKEVIWT